MDKIQKEDQIARITVLAETEFLPATLSFVKEGCARLGITDKATEQLEVAVEEACINVIEHAFDPDEQGSYDVIILRRPGQIVVAVEDQGLPFDFRKFKSGKESGLGVALMKAFADELHFLNLGPRGKRIEIIKNLPSKNTEDYINAKKEGTIDTSCTPVSQDISLTVRLMTPDDAFGLARCFYRCYGYTYSGEQIYFPDRMKERLKNGLQISFLAEAPDGEVVGHSAISKDRRDALIGELGQAITDPRYRKHHILNKLTDCLINYARTSGMYGIYCEAVTLHPYSQQTILSLGGCETALLLGFIPANALFRKIQGEQQQKRQTVIIIYRRVNNEPVRNIYAPSQHQTMVSRIYQRSKLDRNIINVTSLKKQAESAESSQVDVTVKTELSLGFMCVLKYGDDLQDLVKFRLRELCQHRIDCIYIDIPLSNPATPEVCVSLERLGFFFGGVVPETFHGDMLRLQYLNNADVDLENVNLVSDFGKELYDYVIKAGRDAQQLA